MSFLEYMSSTLLGTDLQVVVFCVFFKPSLPLTTKRHGTFIYFHVLVVCRHDDLDCCAAS